MSKFPNDSFCIRCLSHNIVRLNSGRLFCTNCRDSWEPGRQKPIRMSLEGEVLSFIEESQRSGIDLLAIKRFYFSQKRKRWRKKYEEKGT